MWVRSQDKKKLVKSTNVFITYDNGTYIIKSFIEKYNYFDLGQYLTEEKALKVLDMIQNFIGLNDVFQMPQDSEV